ncbi:MAG: response regulator, partial [Anaerolineae bacterium]|nr:response regulator [Anaerolineae bacterium]
FVVEDNVLNRVLVKIILVKHGAEVEFERAGDEAIERLRLFGRTDLVIMDLMLTHGVNGYDLCEQIHALPEYAHIPVVAVSAIDPGVAIPRARERGFAGFIAKPIDDRLFPDQLAQIIAGEQLWHTGYLYPRL